MDARTPLRSSLKVLKNTSEIEASTLWLDYESFQLSLEAAHRSPRTLSYCREKLRPFLSWLEERDVSEVAGITANHIRQFLLDRERAGLAPMSVHHYAACIKAFLNFCVSEELIVASPMRKVKMPKLDEKIEPSFSPEDVRKLLEACRDARDKGIVLFLLDTGLRASEFCSLDAGDLDMKTGAVSVRQGKGKKDRVVFAGVKTRRAVADYFKARGPIHPDDPLWVQKNDCHAYTNERLTRGSLRGTLERLGERAGLAANEVGAHRFRRTFALWSLGNGMDIFSLQRLMGHSSLTVLRRYLDQREQHLSEAHKKHGAVDNVL